MDKEIKISKAKPSDPIRDYRYLHRKGLEHIQRMAGDLWTDYNIHDPGVTIFELLCYAITDLGHRISYPIEDILADNSAARQIATQDKEPSSPFISAKNILPSRPVTIDDYRKLLIDIAGVGNAWLQQDTSHYVGIKDNALHFLNANEAASFESAPIKGLYKVKLALDHGIDAQKQEQVISQVRARLHEHRNLCGDFTEISCMKEQSFIVCAEVDIGVNVDPDRTQAKIFHAIQKHFLPQVVTHSLDGLRAQGKSPAEIFAGPLLEHGFISNEELAQSELREEIHLSDIYRLVMAIQGVKSIRELIITTPDKPVIEKKQWCIPVKTDCIPDLDVQGSRILFFKDIIPMHAHTTESTAIYASLMQQETSPPASCADLRAQECTDRTISRYYSIQNHLPLNYGIGQVGLAQSESPARKAQARQLKAYLLFFDQVLAGCFSQLANVKELFSLKNNLRTYFTQPVSSASLNELYRTPDYLADIDSLAELSKVELDEQDYVYYTNLLNNDEGKEALEKLVRKTGDKRCLYLHDITPNDWTLLYPILEKILEHDGGETLLARRNRFLDHLLARFAESFSEYAWLMFTHFQEKSKLGVLGVKIDFLRDYASISSNRAGAIDYTQDSILDLGNISGMENRLARLLGMNDTNRWIEDNPQQECFFLIEHMLLRPLPEMLAHENAGTEIDNLCIPISVDAFRSGCQCLDPYSFQITVILPAFAGRFADMGFRRFVEKTIRLETPAHILPRVCWVDTEQFKTFRDCYRQWLDCLASSAHSTPAEKMKTLRELLTIHKNLRNQYPSATLCDCKDTQSCGKPFILNRTNLDSSED
jgi:uncharacterized protein